MSNPINATMNTEATITNNTEEEITMLSNNENNITVAEITNENETTITNENEEEVSMDNTNMPAQRPDHPITKSQNKVTVILLKQSKSPDDLTAKQVVFPTTVGLNWLKDNASVDDIIVVDHSFDKQSDEGRAAQQLLEQALENGIDFNDRHYVPALAGSSHIRKGTSIWMNVEVLNVFLNYVTMGFDLKRNMLVNKYLVYLGVSSMSAIKSWEKAFPYDDPRKNPYHVMRPIEINDVVIMNDCTIDIEGVFDKIANNIVSREKMPDEMKVTDGVNYYIVDDMRLSDKQRAKLIERIEAFTFRAPGFKGLAVPVLKSQLISWIDSNNLKPILTDAYGHEFNILTKQLICFKSTFKWNKQISDFEDYKKAFKEYGHEFVVCVTAHKRKADIPYQQFQTLLMDMADAEKLSKASINYISKYGTLEKAPYLLGGALGQAVALLPTMMNDNYVQEQLQNVYKSRRNSIAGGRIPEVAYNPFAAPDTVAIFEHLFGLEPKGIIEPRHMVCNIYAEGKRVDVTRCPHLDNAHCLRRIISVPEELKGFYCGNTAFFSIHDATMRTLQMDYDGDHVNVTDNQFIVEHAHAAIVKQQNVPLFYEAKSSKAGDVTDEGIKTFLAALNPAPVGKYANTLTKVWAYYTGTDAEKRSIALLTEGANTCIDAAKNISGDSETAADTGALHIIDELKSVKKPMFLAYAKSSPFKPGSFEEAKEGCAFAVRSSVDRYSQYFVKSTPEVLPIEKVEGEFNWRWLCRGELKNIPGLTSFGDKTVVDGQVVYVNQGFFNKLVTSTTEEWNEIKKNTSNVEALAEFSGDLYAYVRDLCYAYGAKHGFDAQTTLTCIVSSCYKASSRRGTQAKRTLWAAFGEDLLANIKLNMNDGNVPKSEATEAYLAEIACADQPVDSSMMPDEDSCGFSID